MRKSRINNTNQIFKKNICVNFSNLRENTRIQIQKANKTSNREKQKIKSAWHIILKQEYSYSYNKENTLKNLRENLKVTYKVKLIRITDFSLEVLLVGRV